MKKIFAVLILGLAIGGMATPAQAETFTATAYCNCSRCCGKWADGKTASGTTPVQGRTIAVDKKVIPLGSAVSVDGVEYIAEDTGVRGKHIDIYFDSHSEALKFGVRQVDVEIVTDEQ